MNARCSISFFLLLAAAIFMLTDHADAQRNRGPMVTSMSASIDKDGPHPNKVEIKGPAPITCVSTIAYDANTPTPTCKVDGPGFKGILKKGEKADLTEAGTVTLNCTGRGYVRCAARIN
ncbi:MAG: hypothetical protein WB780_17180 [Candidatus Acidiferrales bacterium]